MKLSDAFPRKYLKAESDIEEGEDKTFTIKTIEFESFDEQGKNVTKPVLYFKGEKKGFVCNKTNAKTISALYGDETDDWEGKQITLMSTEVQFGQDMVWSLRVKKKVAAQKAPARVTQADADEASAAHNAKSYKATAEEEADSKIPF